MIVYEMGSSLVKVYTMAKTFLVENVSMNDKIDMVTNLATLFARGVHWRSSVLGNLKPPDKKLGL